MDTTTRRARAQIFEGVLRAYAPWLSDTPVLCPDCGSEWPDDRRTCPECGLTVESVAQRLADRAAGGTT